MVQSLKVSNQVAIDISHRLPSVIFRPIAKPANQVLYTLPPTIAPCALVQKPVHLEPVFILIDRWGSCERRPMRREYLVLTPWL
jgi:hypothetical protein